MSLNPWFRRSRWGNFRGCFPVDPRFISKPVTCGWMSMVCPKVPSNSLFLTQGWQRVRANPDYLCGMETYTCMHSCMHACMHVDVDALHGLRIPWSRDLDQNQGVAWKWGGVKQIAEAESAESKSAAGPFPRSRLPWQNDREFIIPRVKPPEVVNPPGTYLSPKALNKG